MPTCSDADLIGILDYGAGNLASLLRMFEHLRHPAKIVNDGPAIRSVRRLVIPGVGHFGYAMQELRRRDMIGPLEEMAFGKRVPVLGVCLGMQLLSKSSQEGDAEGLGWVDARTVRFSFPSGAPERIPNMGWRPTTILRPSPLFPPIDKPWRFYFVHSYHLICDNPQSLAATAHYGYDYPAAIMADNIMGTQFHPEKSHRFGMALLSAFAKM